MAERSEGLAPSVAALARRTLDDRVDPFDLRLFAMVASQGSITRAASGMHLSTPAASARLAALEHRVGVGLLTRSKAGAVLTDAGRALLRRAHRVLAELDALQGEMAAFGQGLRGTVRVLCNTAAMVEDLPTRLGRFLAQHPDLDIDLHEAASEAVLDGLRRGIVDVGIVADHVDSSGLTVRPWIEDELVALWPAAWRAPRGPVAFSALLDQRFVGLPADRGLSRLLQQQASISGRAMAHRVRVSHFDALLRLVEAGAGVAVMPRSAASGARSGACRIVPLQDDWARRRLLVCTGERAPGQAHVAALLAALMTDLSPASSLRLPPAPAGDPPARATPV